MNVIMFMLGALSMAILWKISKRTEESILVGKSDPKCRTPVRIKENFYYIVPEKEFVELEILKINKV